MRVVFLENIDKVGKKYEIKDVADGFARNFLIPKKLAKAASEETLKWAEIQKEILEKKAEEGLKKAQGVASSIDGQEVTIQVKIGPEGQLFESITAQKIVEKLKEIGFDVKKGQLDLPEPLKETGEYPIKIKFDHNLESQIQVIISGEAETEDEKE